MIICRTVRMYMVRSGITVKKASASREIRGISKSWYIPWGDGIYHGGDGIYHGGDGIYHGGDGIYHGGDGVYHGGHAHALCTFKFPF